MIVDNIIEVVGRGTIFVVDLIENGYTEVGYIATIPYNVGDIVEYKDEKYVIKGIEAWRVFDKYYKSTIGLNVKKINDVTE